MRRLQGRQHHGLGVWPPAGLERELALNRCRAKKISDQAQVFGGAVKTDFHQHQKIGCARTGAQGCWPVGWGRNPLILFSQDLQLVQAPRRVAIEQAKLGLDLLFDAIQVLLHLAIGQAAIAIIVHLGECRHWQRHHGQHRGPLHMQGTLLRRHQVRASMGWPPQQAHRQGDTQEGSTDQPPA